MTRSGITSTIDIDKGVPLMLEVHGPRNDQGGINSTAHSPSMQWIDLCTNKQSNLKSGTISSAAIARPDATRAAKIMVVIETLAARGSGADDDLHRLVKQYWTLEGEFLAERDPFEDRSTPCDEEHTTAWHISD